MTYEDVAKEAKQLNEGNDCAVKAVALTTDTPYADVRTMMRQRGRKAGRATPQYITFEVIRELGYKRTDVTKCYKSRTIRTLGREMRYRKGRYLVFTSRHVLAVVDGKICDWTQGRLHRIIKIERVERDG